jgi:hypothetical protein
MSSINTLQPTFRTPGFFTEENIKTISELTTQTIGNTYKDKKVVVPNDVIVRFMQIVQEDRIEEVPKMNQRVIMDLVRSFLNFVKKNEQSNYFAENRWNAYMYDPQLHIKPFDEPKLRGERVGRSDLRGFRFHFS